MIEDRDRIYGAVVTRRPHASRAVMKARGFEAP